MTFSLYYKQSRDPKRSLTPQVLNGTRGGAGDYDELIYGDTLTLEKVSRLRDLFATIRLEAQPCDDEQPDELSFRERVASIWRDVRVPFDAASSGSDVTRFLSDVMVRGHATFNAWFEEDAESAWGYRLYMQRIHPSTISRWTFDDVTGVVTGLYQWQARRGDVFIPSADLVTVNPWDDEGPNGISMLRPLLFLFELKKQILFEAGRRAQAQAGIGAVTQGQATDAKSAQAAFDMVNAVMSGEANAIMLPNGWQMQLMQLPSGMDFMPVVAYVDDQINRLFDDMLQSLATKTQGSRALGQTLQNEADWAMGIRMDAVISLFGRRLCGFIADKIGYHGRLPVIAVQEDSIVDDYDALEKATKLASIIPLREGDEDYLRERAGLTVKSEAGGVIERPMSQPMGAGFFSRPVKFSRGLGDPVTFADEPTEFDMDVAWEEIVASRKAAEDRMVSTLAALIERIRADLRTEQEWLPEITKLYYDYLQERRVDTRQAVRNEARSQAQRGVVGPIAAAQAEIAEERVQALIRKTEQRMYNQASLAARQLYQRIRNEEEEKEVYGRTDLPEADAKTLGRPVQYAGRVAEQVGRFEGAATGVGGGLVPVRLWRSGFEDANRCGHCTRQAGTSIDLTVTDFDDVPDLPDPQCEGTVSRCRCGWLVVFGRLEE